LSFPISVGFAASHNGVIIVTTAIITIGGNSRNRYERTSGFPGICHVYYINTTTSQNLLNAWDWVIKRSLMHSILSLINTFYNDNDPHHIHSKQELIIIFGINSIQLPYSVFLFGLITIKPSGNKPIVVLNVNKYSISNMNLYSENDLLIFGTKPIDYYIDTPSSSDILI
jgi:hypothetical protein